MEHKGKSRNREETKAAETVITKRKSSEGQEVRTPKSRRKVEKYRKKAAVESGRGAEERRQL